MAQAMYWTRIRELREAERAGDLNARDEIEQLNEALQIISDDSRRAAYNRGETEDASEQATPAKDRRRKRSPRLMAIGAGAFLASAATLFGAHNAGVDLVAMPVPPLAFILVIGSLGAGLVGAGLQRRVIETPFDILELAPDATAEDIDFAYRTLAGSWLAQLRTAPELALKSLDQLDRAYRAAMARHVAQAAKVSKAAGAGDAASPEAKATRSGGISVPRAGGAIRIGDGVSEAARAFAASLRDRDWQQMGRQTVVLAQQAGTGAVRATQWGIEALIAVYRGEQVNFGGQEEEEPEIQVDLQRRLSASVQVLAQETMEQPREIELSPSQEGLYEIVLETPVGARRVPVGERPLRIGSASDADIAIDESESGGNEQVLLWVNGQDLVLHATAGASCMVNGTPSTWARLEPGDAIAIGGTVLKVEPAA